MHFFKKAVYNSAQLWYNMIMKKGKDNLKTMSSVNWVATDAKKANTTTVHGIDFSDDHHLVKSGRLMDDGIDLIKCLITEDYKKFSNLPADAAAIDYKDSSVPRERMYYEFATTLNENKGSKYIKIVTGGSVWGFIVNTHTDNKFKYGDVLKAASWKAPTRNFARGNVIDDSVEDLRNKTVRWTGVRY